MKVAVMLHLNVDEADCPAHAAEVARSDRWRAWVNNPPTKAQAAAMIREHRDYLRQRTPRTKAEIAAEKRDALLVEATTTGWPPPES
jgi:hypothetical protein